LRRLPYLGAGVVAAGNGSRPRIANLALYSHRHVLCLLALVFKKMVEFFENKCQLAAHNSVRSVRECLRDL
jgi:hypothetical protein